MERKKDWKDFQTLVQTRPDHRAWLYCEDPEEKALRQELLDRLCQVNQYTVDARRTPMPDKMDDIYLTRTSAQINQHVAGALFIETLFENCLQQGSDENLNLIFAFLDAYTAMLQDELKWCNI